MKLLTILTLAFLITHAASAYADDRAILADAAAKLATGAQAVASQAKGSEDRNVRKKFARQAQEIGDDLDGLARRIRKDVPLATVARDLAEIDRDAVALVDAADDAEDKTERKNLRQQATLLEQGVATVRKAAETVANDDDKDKKAPKRPTAITAESFQQLVAAVRDASMDDDKVAVIRQAAQANWFSAAQIGALMDLISFDDSRVDAAVALWPHMVDPQNSFSIFSHLTFDSSKEELRRRVAK